MQKSAEIEKGSVCRFGQIFSSYAWPSDLYITFSTRGLKLPKTVNHSARKGFCARLFTEVFLKIIEDIIDHNLTFRFPLDERRWAHFNMQQITGDHFKALMNKGYLDDLDPVDAGFKTYKMFMTYPTNNGMKNKRISLSKEYSQRIIERQKHGTCYD